MTLGLISVWLVLIFCHFVAADESNLGHLRELGDDRGKKCRGHPLGMENFDISDDQITASSERDSESIAANARPHLGLAWVAAVADSEQYLQIDLSEITIVTGIATYGHPHENRRVTQYILLSGFSEDHLKFYGGIEEKLLANLFDSKRHFQPLVHVRTRLVRVCPVSWLGGIAMCIELFGCYSECMFPLGVSSPKMPNKNIQASSFESHFSRPEYGRLHTESGLGAWCAGVQDTRQYLQIDLNRVMVVMGVGIQGRSQAENWVTAFRVSFSQDWKLWRYHIKDGERVLFRGNSDGVTVSFQYFHEGFLARGVRIHPAYWKNRICMRVELFGCERRFEETDLSRVCLNDEGVEACLCREGFHGASCVDIDECEIAGPIICPENTNCVNTHGSYECTCLGPFSPWFGDKCRDRNECAYKNCGVGATCLNALGSYTCQCEPGFRLDRTLGLSGVCVDMDECLVPGSCPEHSVCTNHVKVFTCECESGYLMDDLKAHCIDVDECALGATCPSGTNCVNTQGSFYCDCGHGYHAVNGTCQDLDECATGVYQCDQHAFCFNTIGSYMCLCKPGFINNENACLDRNECLEGENDCDENAYCDNTSGSYECYCKEGYVGDGSIGNCVRK
ncbi:hemicentin-1 isoform X2 [Nematostella vectensis]|uniref:hemicentin-1 isoform X2 n=1 Tax=Nematostella vectensis TaxID=45351 RepID=UPI002076FBD0|nr:hemicentin-1 isoform X2 [Nematostella vectensis]